MSTPSITFDLHKLGWKAFEDLITCIFRDIMGQTFQSFAEGVDGGRDGAFYGEWSPKDTERMTGSFTVQYKHTSAPKKLLPKSVVKKELPKITRLVHEGLADNYIFVTNHHVTAKRSLQAENAFKKAGAKYAKIYGTDWINTTIAENSTLRRLVPRLYGLGDLTQIVTHQAYRQAREVLDSLAPDLNCFVPTEAYRKCAHALTKQGFVLLIGEPASGKTMIANLLALSAADEWNLQTLMLSSPEEFTQFWNPDDPGQFLWVDDAFGANQYDSGRVREWNQRLSKLKTAIKKGARVVFTSRDYIFNSAKQELKVSAFELFEDSRVVIEVEDLTELERQMILYNHLKCGNQSVKFRKAVKPFLLDAANTPKFLPEIARRFANPKFTKKLRPFAREVRGFFDKPMSWLEEVLSNLAPADKAAIALVFITGGNLPIPIPDEENILRTISTLRSNVGGVKAALAALDESLLRRSTKKGQQYWHFRHPTIRDAFASIIGTNPELVDIYLSGVTTDQLMKEVTCGDLNIEGVKIIIPSSRYDLVMDRLQKFALTNGQYVFFDHVGYFLARRCSGPFLLRYFTEIENMNKLPGKVRVLETYDNSLRILHRLHDNDLLPDSIRTAAVKRIYDLSLKDHTAQFVDKKIVGNLLNSKETACLWKTLKKDIFEDHEQIINDISYNWDEEGDPEDAFFEFENTLSTIEQNGTKEEKKKVESLVDEIRDAVSEMEGRQLAEKEYETLEAEETTVESAPSVRSIFDDVDE